jgi:hypothetical protein
MHLSLMYAAWQLIRPCYLSKETSEHRRAYLIYIDHWKWNFVLLSPVLDFSATWSQKSCFFISVTRALFTLVESFECKALENKFLKELD